MSIVTDIYDNGRYQSCTGSHRRPVHLLGQASRSASPGVVIKSEIGLAAKILELVSQAASQSDGGPRRTLRGRLRGPGTSKAATPLRLTEG